MPGGTSSHDRPPSCISLKSLRGYLPVGPSGAGYDMRKASIGSVISHGTLPSGSKVSVFKDSAGSKEGSARESGSGGSKYDDADEKQGLRLARHAVGSVGGSDQQ